MAPDRRQAITSANVDQCIDALGTVGKDELNSDVADEALIVLDIISRFCQVISVLC